VASSLPLGWLKHELQWIQSILQRNDLESILINTNRIWIWLLPGTKKFAVDALGTHVKTVSENKNFPRNRYHRNSTNRGIVLSRVHTTPCRIVSSKIIISDWLNHIVTSRYTV
jgi:hypothetical protein